MSGRRQRTSLLTYLWTRPYLVKALVAFAVLVAVAVVLSVRAGGDLGRVHIEHALISGYLAFAALTVGACEHFPVEHATDKWFTSSVTMITGGSLGGFLAITILRGFVFCNNHGATTGNNSAKMNGDSNVNNVDGREGSDLMGASNSRENTIIVLTYCVSAACAIILALAGRFWPAVAKRCLLLQACVVTSFAVSGAPLFGALTVAFLQLAAVLVGLLHQLVIALYEYAGARPYLEITQRALFSGGLVSSVLTVACFLDLTPSSAQSLALRQVPFIVRVITLGHVGKPDWCSGLGMLVAALVSWLFLYWRFRHNRHRLPTTNGVHSLIKAPLSSTSASTASIQRNMASAIRK
jgi:hypothetical protein